VPVRIYALAKELDIDSKDLVEICRKAGIPGKGSALASLSEDEVAKVKNFLGAGDKKAEAAGAEQPGERPVAYTRDEYIGVGHVGKIKVLEVSPKPPVERAKPPVEKPVLPVERPTPSIERPAIPLEKPTPPIEKLMPPVEKPIPPVEKPIPPVEKPTPPIEKAKPPAEVVRPAIPEARPPVPETPPAPERPKLSPERMMPPGERIKTLPDRPVPPAGKAEKPPQKEEAPLHRAVKKGRAPVIRLAEMPEIKQPEPKPKTEQVKAQKPDIRLPKHALAGRKPGEKIVPPVAKTGAPPDEAQQEASAPEKQRPQPGVAGKKKSDKRAAPPGEAPLSGKGAKRRPGDGTEEEGERGLAGMASARADRQRSRRGRAPEGAAAGAEEEERPVVAPVRRPKTLTRRHGASTAAPRKEKASLELPCTVRSFSEATGVGWGKIWQALKGMGIEIANINTGLDDETAELLSTELGIELEFKHPPSLEDRLLEHLEHPEDSPESLQPRPPVVTFLGHVDHGKTSLLDYIIGTNVVAGEAGGITQHIRAYQIAKDGRRIAFVDTPGHEAFTEMRARGANVTDIAVLVVAADDGVMPQTEEAISHIRAAEVPIIVALNKIDLPGANPDRALQQLAAQQLLPSEWGGDVEVVRTSATKGTGMDDLLETILLTADMQEFKANPDRAATGVCLEAEQQAGRGVIAKLIVQHGTLKVGDVVLCGATYGRVKAMYDTLDTHRRVEEAGPSTPVNITGLETPPNAGERFYVVGDISQAREIADQRASRSRKESLAGLSIKVSFEEFQRRLSQGNLADTTEKVTLNLILRADVRGSIEAIEKELSKLEHPEVQVKVLHKSVGAVTAGDVMLAHASQAVIIGFNVMPDEAARALADEKQVEIRRYDIIYMVTDDIKALLEGKLKPEERVVELGRAIVKRVFPISRVGTVAGCYVIHGSIARGCRVRVNRDGRTIGDYELESLRREKDDVREVPRGMECGMRLAGFNDIKQDDVLEAYKIEEVARTL
jgi:translation initiation factor IF-2